jgi:hypothetical protein
MISAFGSLRFQALRLGVMKKAFVVGVANGAQAMWLTTP